MPFDPVSLSLALSRARNLAPLTNRASYAYTSAAMSARTAAGTWTWCLSIPIEDDAHAVRIALANDTTTPFVVNGASVCPSATYSDYVNATGGASWINLGWTNGGAENGPDADLPLTPPISPQAFTVPGNAVFAATGSTTVPKVVWTDWAPIRTLPRTDGGPGRILFIRVNMPTGTWPCTRLLQSNGGITGKPEVHGGRDMATKAITSTNAFTAPDQTYTPVNVIETPVYAVQVLTRRPGVQVTSMGDSQIAGDGSGGNVASFIMKAVWALSRTDRPVHYHNSAWGGQNSSVFWPVFMNNLAAVQPRIAIVEGWTGNDGTTDMERYRARRLSAMERVRQAGGVPILCTPFPREAARMDSETLAAWKAQRAECLEYRAAGGLVFDGASLIGDVATGLYLPGMTTDLVHANQAGHDAMAPVLADLLRSVVG